MSNLYLTIPAPIAGYGLKQLIEHVVDTSPVYRTAHSVFRLGFKALDAVESAANGVATMSKAVGEVLQKAAEAAPLPEIQTWAEDANGKLVPGSLRPIPARLIEPLYEAIANMSATAPVAQPVPLDATPDAVPVAAE